MRVEFEFTQKDLVDASKRFMARSKVVRSWRWKDLATAAILSWGIVFAVFWTVPFKGAVIGLLASLITALIYPSFYRSWFF